MPNVLKRPNPGYFCVVVPQRYLKINLTFSWNLGGEEGGGEPLTGAEGAEKKNIA